MKVLICPGAPRSGTTFFFNALKKHNLTSQPISEKEINFFSQSYDPDLFIRKFKDRDKIILMK